MKERRRGPDAILKMINAISIVLWVIIGIVFIIFAITNPTHSGLAASRPGFKSRPLWADSIIYGLLIIQIVLSVAGIIFNLTRLKRKTDRLKLTLVVSLILGIFTMVIISIK
ncbi:MAG TPA: hypothetical protein PKX79_13030 [Spirochaetota bacterium]|jgi:uncharacterized membrane protein YkvI|nr:hypothetical protein [Spirochaetota bacterium]HPP96287.1 hypothetical protein [Spirochaetota bacterium]